VESGRRRKLCHEGMPRISQDDASGAAKKSITAHGLLGSHPSRRSQISDVANFLSSPLTQERKRCILYKGNRSRPVVHPGGTLLVLIKPNDIYAIQMQGIGMYLRMSPFHFIDSLLPSKLLNSQSQESDLLQQFLKYFRFPDKRVLT
jgi:hypothetical protein